MARTKKADDPNAKGCMVKGCTGKAKWKGICPSCYAGAKQMIEDEKTTWVELQMLGLVEGPTIVSRFTELKQLKLFDPTATPVDEPEPPKSTLETMLVNSDPVRHADVRGNETFSVPGFGRLTIEDLGRVFNLPTGEVRSKLESVEFVASTAP